METVYQALVYVHLLTVAALLITVVLSFRGQPRPAHRIVQVAAGLQLLTGLGLAGIAFSGAIDVTPNAPKLAVKLLVAVAASLAAIAAQRTGGYARRNLAATGALTMGNVLIATLW